MLAFGVGDRVRPDYDYLQKETDQRNISAVLAAENFGGWMVLIDQRESGGEDVILESKDWRGETRHLRIPAQAVRAVFKGGRWHRMP